MDELVDILDELGNPTGVSALKSVAHKKGLFHPTVHVWFFTDEGEILFQKRAASKKTFPGLWDVSVAGHIAAGESIEVSAQREVLEEIGLEIKISDLTKVGVFKTVHHHPNHMVDAEFNHCFLAELKVGLETLNLQDEEVEDVKLIPTKELKQLVELNEMDGFVPISNRYWNTLFDALNSTG